MKTLNILSRIESITVRRLLLSLQGCIFLSMPTFAQGDALNEAATLSALASHSLFMDVERVENKLVAVGERGHILISSDEALSWTQVEHVPVRVTLTAVHFTDKDWGWAVGHDGVVLRTHDGGQHWAKILDGFQANQLVLGHAQALVTATEQAIAQALPQDMAALEEKLDGLVYFRDDAESFNREGASRPFLDVWFKNANEGIIIGGYGLILHTSNGGDSWTPSFQSLENPDAFHLNKIEQVGDSLFLAGEAGTLYRSTDWGTRWTLLESPYEGSFFGVVAAKNNGVLAYGLRGNAFLSHDNGDSWTEVDTGVDASLFGAALLKDGSNVLVGAGGVIIYIDGQGQLIEQTQSKTKLPISSVLPSIDQGLLTVGLGGILQIPGLISTTTLLMTDGGRGHE